MSPSTPPIVCGLALAAISAAGFSHCWSVHQLVLAHTPALSSPVPAAPATPAPVPPPVDLPAPDPAPSPPASPAREQFYETLLAEIRELRSQNRDLRDQIAETNRDVMKLEFRVDTHSESFRPLPVSEERPDTSFGPAYDDLPGVLPPRAQPVDEWEN